MDRTQAGRHRRGWAYANKANEHQTGSWYPLSKNADYGTTGVYRRLRSKEGRTECVLVVATNKVLAATDQKMAEKG